jgi:hypothetical protein
MSKVKQDLLIRQNQLIERALFAIGFIDGHDSAALLIVNDVNNKWFDLLQEAATAFDKEAAEERVAKITSAMAKALPAAAESLRDAIRGFQSGDPFAGSASVMDLCSTLSTLVGAVSSVGGPPGALVGALFSLVSMVLKMFVKPQTDLSRQIEDMARGLAAEGKLENLAAAQGALRNFMTTISTPGTKWTLEEKNHLLNVTDGAAINSMRTAAQWLRTSENQKLKLWPEVLAAQCHTYGMLLHAWTLAIAQLSVNPEAKAEHLIKLRGNNASNDQDQLSFVRAVAPAARMRGPLWHLGTFSATGTWPDSGDLYVGDAHKPDMVNLKGEHRVFTVANRAGGKEVEARPYLAVFALEPADSNRIQPGGAYFNRKNKRTFALFGQWPLDKYEDWREIPELNNVHGICATPGLNEQEVLVYTATGTGIERYVHGGSFMEGGKLVAHSMSFRTPGHFVVDSVAAVTDPVMVSASDSIAGGRWIVYGGLSSAGRQWIWADFHKGPTGLFACEATQMTGMKVDQKYLWIFTRQFIACITHLQAKNALEHSANPQWMVYRVPEELGGIWGSEGKFDGLRDIAPCDDGSLIAVFNDKSENRIYQAFPAIDLTKGTLVIEGWATNNYGQKVKTNGWSQIEGAEANRVLKQPVFCWSALAGLEATLLAGSSGSLTGP